MTTWDREVKRKENEKTTFTHSECVWAVDWCQLKTITERVLAPDEELKSVLLDDAVRPNQHIVIEDASSSCSSACLLNKRSFLPADSSPMINELINCSAIILCMIDSWNHRLIRERRGRIARPNYKMQKITFVLKLIDRRMSFRSLDFRLKCFNINNLSWTFKPLERF